MKKNETTKKIYESPEFEVVEFSFEDSIATSGTNGVGLWEQVWGGGDV